MYILFVSFLAFDERQEEARAAIASRPIFGATSASPNPSSEKNATSLPSFNRNQLYTSPKARTMSAASMGIVTKSKNKIPTATVSKPEDSPASSAVASSSSSPSPSSSNLKTHHSCRDNETNNDIDKKSNNDTDKDSNTDNFPSVDSDSNNKEIKSQRVSAKNGLLLLCAYDCDDSSDSTASS